MVDDLSNLTLLLFPHRTTTSLSKNLFLYKVINISNHDNDLPFYLQYYQRDNEDTQFGPLM